MKVVVVYESLWGNTAAIADAIADGAGAGSALSTTEATAEALEGTDLLIAGAPIHAFSLPRESGRANLGGHDKKAPKPADLSHPPLRTWLDALPAGGGRAAAFETGFKRSPGSATKVIAKRLEGAGYAMLGRERFLVDGSYGPVTDGEIERARAWGAALLDAADS